MDSSGPETERLIAAAAALAPLVAEHRAALARGPDLPAPIAEALHAAGLTRLWLPRALGGPELPPADYIRVIEAVARLDGAVGWCAAIAASGARLAGLLPPEAAASMFGPKRRGLSGSLNPAGTAVPVENGFRVSGRWNWGSSQFPCCRACTLKADPGETWIHVHGARSHVLDLAVLRSAIAQGDAGGSDTGARHHRGSAAIDIGGMPGLLQPVAARSQLVSARVARSPLAGSPSDDPRRGSPLSLLEPPLRPPHVRRAPGGCAARLSAAGPGGCEIFSITSVSRSAAKPERAWPHASRRRQARTRCCVWHRPDVR